MKKTIIVCLIIILLFAAPSAFAQTPEITNALSYLNSVQNPDGSWGDLSSVTDVLPATVSAIETLQVFGDTSSQSYIKALSWLQNQSIETTDYLSERISALSVSGKDQNILISYLDEINANAWGGYDDHEANNLDTALALIALNKTDCYDFDTVGYALAYLIDNQNLDGGFGFYHEDDSNTYITSIVLRTFALYNGVFDFQDEVNAASAFLLTKQNPDGGFGSSLSTVYETALAFIALTGAGQKQTLPLQNAVNYLQATQQANGSWNDDPYSTALALQAFASVKPDLKISYSDITFSGKSPTVGETITITATIHNESIAQADGVMIRFYDGNLETSGALISEDVIASIAPYGSSQTTANWTVPSPGTHAIFVKVDPDETVPETDETNNTALNYVTSATPPDLSVSSADIAFSLNVPAPDEPVTITVTVRNHGETAANNVTVDVYIGDPSSGGSIIKSSVITSIEAGGSASAQVTGSFPSGNHSIFTVIDSGNAIAESNESNNAASRILQVGTVSGEGIDLSVYAGDISFSKAYPVTGDVVAISASVHNQGEADTANVLARFYLGDPDSGGLQLGSDIVIPAIAAGGSATVTATLNTAGLSGSKNIYVRIDPNNVIRETMELNNTAFKTMKIAVKTGTDLMVSNGEITFSPSLPVSGDMVTITAKIRNLSYVAANNVLVEFSDGNPNIAGSRIIGRVVITSISASQTSPGIAQITYDTTGLSGMHDIYVNVDPLNQIAELDEKDNIAYAPLNIAPPQKPDITVTSIDRSNLITHTQTNEISGFASINIENIGIQDTQLPFTITLYENNDNKAAFDTDTDNILGQITYSNNIAAGASEMIDIPVSGNVLFRDNIIYAIADSDKEIDELDEGNNTTNTAEQCKADKPVCEDFDVVEKFAWTGSMILPSANNVYGMPIVAQLTDDNGDGAINSSDTPDIIFHSTNPLRAISGDDGHELFTVTNPNYFIWQYTNIAAGDIDNDSIVEIVSFLVKTKPQVVAFENDGTVKWVSEQITITSDPNVYNRMGVSIADIDSDGSPEIICGPNVLNSNGTIRWSVNRRDTLPAVADLDMDGYQEVIIGNNAYRHDGTLYWSNSMISIDSITHAVANLDDDPYPELIQFVPYSSDVWVYVFEHDGALKWGPLKLGLIGMPAVPSVADFDGDGEPEIGISSNFRYVVFEADGNIKWQTVLYDTTGGGLGTAVFDFDGDGAVEIVHNDMQHLRILSGRTGEVLFSTPNSTITMYDSTVVADVDNDGSAEIVTNANKTSTFDYRGIRVFENECDRWENTRKIWNEYNYHITNVNDDGTIPQFEQNNWEVYNNYRANLRLPGPDDIPDITTSLITVDPSDYPSSVTISARIGNGGAAAVPAGVTVSFYDGDPSSGGTLIGTTTTSKVLGAGEYEDVYVLYDLFDLYSTGNREIFVIADEDDLVAECREDNNTAFAVIDLAEDAYVPKPDLAVSSSDISITPSNPIEGQPAVISAVVHNTGEADALSAKVSFYDGNPANSGTLIGSVTGLNISAGSTASAEITWSTLGQTGVNFIHVKADPEGMIEDSNENNNSSLIKVEVMPPVKPDITSGPGDMVFSAAGPTEGDPLTLTVTVRNNGTGAGNVKVNLYDNDVLAGTHTIFTIIPFIGHEQVVFNIDTVGIPGSHTFNVVLDPDNAINEQNEGNNAISADLIINSIGLGLTATTDRAVYYENEDVLITVNVTDLQNETRDLSVGAGIYDPSGALAAALASQPVTLGQLGTETLAFKWNNGKTLIGDYFIKVTAYDAASNPLARQSAPITIASSDGLAAIIYTDKISYAPNETAEITSMVMNNSANIIFENITAEITVMDQSGQMLYSESKRLPLVNRSHMSYRTYWNTGVNPAGDYPVTIELKDGNNVLFAGTGNITIASAMDPSDLLAGMISVDTQSVFQGEPVGIMYSVTNTGNIDLAQIDISILTVHVTALTIHDTLSDKATLLMGDTYSNTQLLDTQNYTAKDYLVILRANIQGEEATLASTYFRVEGAPSVTSLYQPVHGDDVETLTPSVSVNNASDPNDDDLTYEFELYSDSGLSNLIASSGVINEGQNTTSWTAPLELEENSVYYWRARAFDDLLYGDWMQPASFRVNIVNDAPIAPTLSGPADSSEVGKYTPVLAVNNAYDPDSDNLTYNFEVALDPGFTRIAASGTGIFEGQGTTSWQVPLDLNEDTYYYWRAQADDWLMEGTWMSPAVFFVNVSNNGPERPVVIEPADGSEVTAVLTGITLLNSTDPEGDALTYEFELDTAITFDSTDLVSVTGVPAGTGMTTWHVEGLQDNTLYYVRGRANDGLALSPWSGVAGFFVNTANDAPSVPVPANPSDGAGVNLFNPLLSVHNSTDIDRDALTYEFEIYADAAMTINVASAAGIEETEQTTSWTVPATLAENHTYYWQARAYDGELFSGWTPLSSFMVNTSNDAPAAPLLVSPAEGSSLETPYPSLSIFNATDPDADALTYDFEIYSGGNLARSITGVPENNTGITSVILADALADDTAYTWRARAYDGDRYGAWMDMASFSIHFPSSSMTATVDFDPDTLNRKSSGKWVVVYIELPSGHDVHDIDVSSIMLEETISAEARPYNISDHDKDGIPDLMVKFRRADVISVLPAGDSVAVTVTGNAGDVEFEGVDAVRVIP